MSQTAKHIIFKGRVQGIGFRFTSLNIANRYHLTGLVRNLLDGTVEMIAQGEPDDVIKCIRGIEKAFEGYITETNVTEISVNARYKDFKITF